MAYREFQELPGAFRAGFLPRRKKFTAGEWYDIPISHIRGFKSLAMKPCSTAKVNNFAREEATIPLRQVLG
jgi:hypothetical protein